MRLINNKKEGGWKLNCLSLSRLCHDDDGDDNNRVLLLLGQWYKTDSLVWKQFEPGVKGV